MADLTVSELALRCGEAEILKGVSVTVPAGMVVALLGPPGSGKSMLLRAVAGLESPYRGSIRIGGKLLYDADLRLELPAETRGLALVLRSYALWPHRSVFQNVAYGLKMRRVPAEDIRGRVAIALDRVALAHLADRYPHELSSDQQQRVALARALIYEPAVILLDEPMSNLDAKLREEARGRLRHLITSLKLCALLATHDQVEAMAIADRIILLNHGLIEQEGSPIDLYREPATLFAAEFMGANNRLEGTLVEKADKRAVIEVKGVRLEGVARTTAAIGEKATGVIRLDKVILGGGLARPNRIPMSLKAQMYIGEHWELLFAKDELAVRAHVTAPLKHELYSVEFPPDALWIF
ncbi:MAG TPA: ABC transporter ATP-binding protein [Xanthobacteraceae bacterium]|jgi:iron(III) transport system ATP-binding protein